MAFPWMVIPAVASALGALFGKKNSGQPSSDELGQQTQDDFAQMLQIPEIRDLLQLQMTQALRQEPLSQAANQLAFQLLPVSARAGINFNTVPTPQLSSFPAATPSPYGSAANLTVGGNTSGLSSLLPPSVPSPANPPPSPSPTGAVRRRRPQ